MAAVRNGRLESFSYALVFLYKCTFGRLRSLPAPCSPLQASRPRNSGFCGTLGRPLILAKLFLRAYSERVVVVNSSRPVNEFYAI